MAKPTKKDLELELEDMRVTLESAHEALGEALGYDSTAESDEDCENPEEESD